MSEKNNWIIEDKDVLTFDIKVKEQKEQDGRIFKLKNRTVTIGKDEILPGLDKVIIGTDLSEDKFFEIDVKIDEESHLLNEIIHPGMYILSFRVIKLQKHNSREHLDVNNLKEDHDLKKKIKELEEIKNKLTSKVERLEVEKQLSEQIFKTKAEEMAKNAATKVEILKEEIKNKAKEEIEYKTKFAVQKLVDDLLSPLNNLYVAVEAGAKVGDPGVSAYVKGFQMLTSQIFNTLEAHGIYSIDPKVGDVFNPEFHHAQEVVQDLQFSKDQIVKVISRGYRLHERILKPAIVIVAK